MTSSEINTLPEGKNGSMMLQREGIVGGRGTGTGSRLGSRLPCIDKNTIDLTIPFTIAIRPGSRCF